MKYPVHMPATSVSSEHIFCVCDFCKRVRMFVGEDRRLKELADALAQTLRVAVTGAHVADAKVIANGWGLTEDGRHMCVECVDTMRVAELEANQRKALTEGAPSGDPQ